MSSCSAVHRSASAVSLSLTFTVELLHNFPDRPICSDIHTILIMIAKSLSSLGIRIMFSNGTACDSTSYQKLNENSVKKEKQNSVAELDANWLVKFSVGLRKISY